MLGISLDWISGWFRSGPRAGMPVAAASPCEADAHAQSKPERRAQVARRAQLLREGTQEQARVAPPPPPFAKSVAPEGVMRRLDGEAGDKAIRVALPQASAPVPMPPPPVVPTTTIHARQPHAIPAIVPAPLAEADAAAVARPAFGPVIETDKPAGKTARPLSARPHLNRSRMPLVAPGHAPRPTQRAHAKKPSRQPSARAVQAQCVGLKASQRPRTINRPVSQVAAKRNPGARARRR